jgi:hypothetical protein
VAKRPRFSRWRRLPPVFRSGEHRPIGSGNELDRIILYIPTQVLDWAEALAEKAGAPSIQEYCAQLLGRAIESERVQKKVAELEARRGPLEGLKEIAADPDYLAEWQARTESKPEPQSAVEASANRPGSGGSLPGPDEAITVDLIISDEAIGSGGSGTGWEADEEVDPEAPVSQSPGARTDLATDSLPIRVAKPGVGVMSDRSSKEVLLRHVLPEEDVWGFLPCLRRGAPVPAAKAAELIRALGQLELEHRHAEVLDRGLAHALHRLALESQVLLTDAWPGVFDERVIAEIRTVQEAVERILSGQDIRYYPSASRPGSEGPR